MDELQAIKSIQKLLDLYETCSARQRNEILQTVNRVVENLMRKHQTDAEFENAVCGIEIHIRQINEEQQQ